MNPSVDFFFEKDSPWQACYKKLRGLLLACGLTEALKWGVPCYTFQSKNIVLMHGFKDYCALLFHKGVLLNDAHNLLVQQTPNVQAARQMRFRSLADIEEKEAAINAYLYEAIEVEKAGLAVPLKTTAEFSVPEEFSQQLEADPALKLAFEGLTPGRQRGYLLYFAQPKQAKTREARIAKCRQQILKGKGLKDR